MSNMRIITGSTGTTHVTSQDDRSLNACIYSQDNVVFNVGSKFAHTVVDNNTIIIADGDLLLQGCHARIDYNLSEEVAIDTGALGMKRVDFICARYSIDTSTGYESVNLHVVKGTASASEYVDPEVEEGLLREGAQTVDFPLYRVKLNGINIEDVEQLFTPQSSLNSNLTKLVATLTSGQTTVTWTDDRLSGDNVFLEFYADIQHKDLMPSEISVSGNVLTATYDSQSENVIVGVAISNQ